MLICSCNRISVLPELGIQDCRHGNTCIVIGMSLHYAIIQVCVTYSDLQLIQIVVALQNCDRLQIIKFQAD